MKSEWLNSEDRDRFWEKAKLVNVSTLKKSVFTAEDEFLNHINQKLSSQLTDVLISLGKIFISDVVYQTFNKFSNVRICCSLVNLTALRVFLDKT